MKRDNRDARNGNAHGRNLWKNDWELAKIVQAVTIPNQDFILKQALQYGSSEIVGSYAELIAIKRLEAAKKRGLNCLETSQDTLPSSVEFLGRDHIVRVCPGTISEPMNRSGLDRTVRNILTQINGYSNVGVLQFLPYVVNGREALDYLKKELPCIAFVDLRYNPKQIEQRVYHMTH